MMLVIEVVTTALLLVAGAVAQKPTTLDRSAVNTSQVREGLAIPRQPSVLTETLRLHDRDKTSQIEFPPDEYLNLNISPHSGKNMEANKRSDDFETKENTKRSERLKRKVIFGGGSYGHSGRRSGSSAVGGDPYGRRRDHSAPYTGTYESWPDREQLEPNKNMQDGSTSAITGSTRRSDYVIVSRTTMATPTVPGSRSSSIVVPEKQESSTGNGRSKTLKSEAAPKKKLTKNVKWEIAKYALQHGEKEAADKYEDILGRKLPPKKIEKFIKRYQKQQKRNRGYHQ